MRERFSKKGNHVLRVLREQCAAADSGSANDVAVIRAALNHAGMSAEHKAETAQFLGERGVPVGALTLMDGCSGEVLEDVTCLLFLCAVNGFYSEDDSCEDEVSRKVDRWSSKKQRMIPSRLWNDRRDR